VEQSYVDQLYRDISVLRIELEPDPTILGARYIQSVTSKCRNYLNKVSLIRIQLNQKKRNLMMQIAGEETALTIEKSRLLAEDDTVKRGSNIADREAIANTMLRQQINHISTMKMDLLDIDTVDKAVKMAHDELIRTSQEIKVQRSLLFSDRISGAGYGDETPISGGSQPPSAAADINENELENLMKGSVPLIKDPAPEEEDPDLLAALASIEEEDPPAEVNSAVEVVVAEKPSLEPVVPDMVPQDTKPVEEGLPILEEDLLGFLEAKPVSKKAVSKKPNGSDDPASKVVLDDIDMDFNDILSNV
jgi:hypothetical protein